MLTKYLKTIKPNIVHFCIGISPLDFLIPSICHNLKIPITGIWHGDINQNTDAYSIYIKSVLLFFLPITKQLDSFVVFSKKLKSFYVNRGLDEKRISIIQNGVNTLLFKPGLSNFKNKHAVKTGVIFLGRLTLVKNPEILIKSFLDLNPPPTTKLIMVGTGDLYLELKNTYRDQRIIFTGLIADEKTKVDILRAGNIFVLPSDLEGISLALLEAMATGLACISTDAGSNGDILGNSGIVIHRPKIEHELPFSLKILLQNSVLRKSLGNKARKKVLKLYKENVVFKKYEELYLKTIADYKKRGCLGSRPLEFNVDIKEKLEHLWRKAKELGANYLFSE
jgi:glycosyltransferase involved in cell wall biosynthesis